MSTYLADKVEDLTVEVPPHGSPTGGWVRRVAYLWSC